MSEPYIALQVMMMPRDANPQLTPTSQHNNEYTLYSSIFGGVILSYIDQAGAIGARRDVTRAGGVLPNLVTVAINRVEFKQPVLVGDVVRFITRQIKLGRTSITVHVQVEAERGTEVLQVTEAELVYVRVDPLSRRPIPLIG